jgi:hypothetical protein
MEFINEYALLVVVAAPVAVIVTMNVLLAMAGEAGTLLLPSSGELASYAGEINVAPATTSAAAVGLAANDEMKLAA